MGPRQPSSEVTASPSRLAELLEKYRDPRRFADYQPPSSVRPQDKRLRLGQPLEVYGESQDGRPSLSHIITQSTSAPPPQSSAYIEPPLYSTSNTQMHLSSLLGPTADCPVLKKPHETPSRMSAGTTHTSEVEAMVSDDSFGYSSPTDASLPSNYAPNARGCNSFSVQGVSLQQNRDSFGTTIDQDGSIPDIQGAYNSLYKAPSADCRYRCLEPVLPYLRDIIPASVACDLLDVYLTEPGSSLFRCASPYIITRIFRKKSLLHPISPRQTTPALLATMLWCSAQTADIVLLHVPGSRAKICNALYDLATALISDRDPDRWRRMHGAVSPRCAHKGLGVKADVKQAACVMRATHHRAAFSPRRHSHSPPPGTSPRALLTMF